MPDRPFFFRLPCGQMTNDSPLGQYLCSQTLQSGIGLEFQFQRARNRHVPSGQDMEVAKDFMLVQMGGRNPFCITEAAPEKTPFNPRTEPLFCATKQAQNGAP